MLGVMQSDIDQCEQTPRTESWKKEPRETKISSPVIVTFRSISRLRVDVFNIVQI